MGIECTQSTSGKCEKIPQKFYYEIENTINCQMRGWCNIIHASERIRRSFHMTNIEIPRKDHKTYDNMSRGPPLRPACGATVANKYRLSYFLSMILRPFVKLAEEICDSTDDMLSRINKCNENTDIHYCIIGSFDVDALYPSIDINFVIEMCLELILGNTITFEDTDFAEVGLYLALTVKKKELESEYLLDFCPTRNMIGRPSTITSSGKQTEYDKRW